MVDWGFAVKLPKGLNPIEMEITGQILAKDVESATGLKARTLHVIRLNEPMPVRTEVRGYTEIGFQFTLLGWQDVDYFSIVGRPAQDDEEGDYVWIIVGSAGFQVWPRNTSEHYVNRVDDNSFMEAVFPFARCLIGNKMTGEKYRDWVSQCQKQYDEAVQRIAKREAEA